MCVFPYLVSQGLTFLRLLQKVHPVGHNVFLEPLWVPFIECLAWYAPNTDRSSSVHSDAFLVLSPGFNAIQDLRYHGEAVASGGGSRPC
jgi:hypothetical protein